MAEEREDANLVETVDDDKDAEETNASTENPELTIESARAQAEKRRKRILEKANNRMQYVNGEMTQDEEEKKESLSKAARIRAARQRRYGKKSAASSNTTAVETESKSEVEVEEASQSAETSTETVEPTKDEPEDHQDKIAPVASEESAEPTTKKKYVGVARMRRNMLIKKKKEEENIDNDPGANTTARSKSEAASAPLASDGKISTAATSTGNSNVLPVKVQTIPIYMHMLVILLLFVAGFDVGVQQFHTDIDVRTQVAVQEFGVPFVQRNPWNPLKPISTERGSKQALEEKISPSTLSTSGSGKDEFDEDDIDEEHNPPIIDPIFRVDLDEKTKGPGILNQMARGAISIHRLLLWLFYYGPMGFLGSFLSLPAIVMQTPPGLFLIAIALRQVLGKAVLGANIPENSGEDGADGTKQNKIEVISVAKNMVKSFFSTNFPKLVTFYDGYLHLKSDMYVVFCGVFFGLAWTHLRSDTESCAAEPIVGVGDDGYGGEEL